MTCCSVSLMMFSFWLSGATDSAENENSGSAPAMPPERGLSTIEAYRTV